MNLPIHTFSDFNIANQIQELTAQLDKVTGQAKIKTQNMINRYQEEQVRRTLLKN
jgi:hypothetical protein|tara:strand:+ start:172 stop:336 length:165 start_codon:yes stop_codon:yes gene_type:complete